MDEPIILPEPDQEWHARHDEKSRMRIHRNIPWRRILTIVVVIVLVFFLSAVGGVVGFVGIANNDSTFARQLRKTLGLNNLSQLSIPVTENIKLQESSAVIDAAKKVSPAVVSVTANAQVTDFYGNTSNQEISGGTGFIITSDGLIITNKHVVSDTTAQYKVVLNDGTVYNATVQARDPLNDLAVLKISASNLPTVELGTSDDLQIGQSVIAIGNALGQFNNSVTYGIVSAKNRTLSDVGDDSTAGTSENLSDLIQTDAAINPGNSGGPLVNMAGEVVGIDTAIASTDTGGGSVGLGFAIAIDSIKSVINSVRTTGTIVRPYLGVRYLPITKNVETADNLSVDYGALVQGDATNPAIVPGSPAAAAGIQAGDIILQINSDQVNSDHPLTDLLQKYNVGDKLSVVILRGGKQQTLSVTLAQLPNE